MSGWQLSELRQRTIAERLALVGQGPVQHFTDACRLMDRRNEFGSTTHLVGHSLREVQSALTTVLRPMVPDAVWPEDDVEGSQALKIAALCDALRVPPEDEVRRSWKAFARKLSRYAHRAGIARSRPVDEEFEIFWDQAQAVLLAVTGRIEATYAEALPRIEELALGKPDTYAFTQTMLHSTVALDRFFDLAGVAWLEPLRAKGYFDDPPALIPNDEGGYGFPRWPQGRFLARVAKDAPTTVVEIGCALHTDNPEAHQSLVDAAISIPVADALPLVGPICDWLQTPVQWALPFKAREFAVDLVEGGAIEEGLAVTRALLTNPEADADVEVAGEHLVWLVPQIFPASGMAGLEMVISLLKVRLGAEGADTHSYVWRPDIATGRREDDRDQLVDGARHAADLLVESGTSVVAIVAAMEAPETQIGRRLALDLLGRHPTSSTARERLLDRNALEDRATRYEYLALASAVFPTLDESDRDLFLGWIEGSPRAEEDASRRSIWQLGVLTALEGSLPPEWESRRREFVKEFGPFDLHPRRMVASYSGDISPLNLATLRAMELDDLVEYIQSWVPEEAFSSPTRSGLANVLENAVVADPVRFASGAIGFANVNPAYTGAILGGLRKAVDAGTPFDWRPVLDLVASTDDDKVVTTGPSEDEGVRRVRLDGAELIWHGLFRGPAEVPAGLLGRVLEVLTDLFENAEPTVETEKEREEREPTLVAINSARCRALQGLCRLAARDREEGALNLRPELARILQSALEPEIGSSAAVRWTLGGAFRELLFADRDWTAERCDALFSLDAEGILWRASWAGYIRSETLHPVALELLDAQYRRAIEEMSPEPSDLDDGDPDGFLVTNLMSHYLSGTIDFDEPDGLLDLLYLRMSTERRRLAIESIGRGLDAAELPPPDVVRRMEALAKRRLDAVKDGAPPEELSGIARWIESGGFEVEWSLKYLRELLDAGGSVHPDHMVAEWLSRRCALHQLAAVEILRLLVENATRDWFVIGARDSIETILRAGLAAGGDAESVARDVVSIIVSQGAVEFADLLTEPDDL